MLLLILDLLIICFCRLTFSNRTNELNGVRLRGSIFDYRPFFMFKNGVNLNMSNYEPAGLSADLMDYVAGRHNMTWQFVPVDPVKWAKDGPEVALMNQLVNGEVDFVFFPFVRSLDFKNQIELSHTTSIDAYTLLQPWPLEVSRLTAPVRPFSQAAWLFFLFSAISVAGVLTILSHFQQMWNAHAESDRHRNKSLIEHLSESVEYVLSIVTAQGNYIACNAWNCTFLLSGLWLLAMVVFVNAYTGTLISYLTVPKLNPVINSLEQLVAETDWKLSIEKNSEFSKQILDATSGVYKTIGDSFQQDPGLLITDYYKPMELVTSSSAVFFCSVPHALYMMASDYKKYKHCRMTISSKQASSFHVTSYGFGMLKHGPYNKYINQDIITGWDYGFQYKYVSKYFPRADQCERNDDNIDIAKDRSIAPLRLNDVAGIFSLLGIGLAVSCLAFLAEIAAAWLSGRNRD